MRAPDRPTRSIEQAPSVRKARPLQATASNLVGKAKWSGRRDSNPRPQPWQGCALPLSYTRSHCQAVRTWSGRRDSNPRPQPWQGCALPLSYTRPNPFGLVEKLERAKGFEPSTPTLARLCSTPELHPLAVFRRRHRGGADERHKHHSAGERKRLRRRLRSRLPALPYQVAAGVVPSRISASRARVAGVVSGGRASRGKKAAAAIS
jgi:hypothetical protein